MISTEDWSRAVHVATTGTLLADSELHGEAHWRAVAGQGILLAELCNFGQSGRAAGALFGLFHDCRRENDDHDPEHGLRGARAFAAWAQGTSLSAALRDDLIRSMVLHDAGQVTTEPGVGLGWDADRSTLGRVGIAPHPRFFSCIPADGFTAYVDAGRAATRAPLCWDEIYARAFA